jgi:hypothetical protein
MFYETSALKKYLQLVLIPDLYPPFIYVLTSLLCSLESCHLLFFGELPWGYLSYQLEELEMPEIFLFLFSPRIFLSQ